MATRLGLRNDSPRQDPRCISSTTTRQQVPSTYKHKILLMKSPRNPWQKLLQEHIQNKECPPRPEGFKTRAEIMELSGKKSSSIDRLLRELLDKKKLEVTKIKVVLSNKKGHTFFRWIKAYKMLDKK